MKCIDDEVIQKYIDGETNSRETAEIEKHLANCSPCAQNIEEQRAFADAVKNRIENWSSQPVVVPEFVATVVPKRKLNVKIRHYIYAASAACAALLLFFLISEHNGKNRENEIQLIYTFVGDFDANRTISQQEMTIIVIDANGKIVEYN
jgi:predicted anti-sigma-YlaC factor YlaD